MKMYVALISGLVIFFAVCCAPVFGAGAAPGKETGNISGKAGADKEAGDPKAESDLFAEYDDMGGKSQSVADPIYYFNYAMYQVNDTLYFYALKPLARGYKAVVPTDIRQCIGRFFTNLLFPVRFANCLLQGKVGAAGDEFASFLLNSTVGVLGFNNFAQTHMGISRHEEDLGQTLGSYRIGDGFYLVLPVLGPSTLRDTVGRVGDLFATPTTYIHPWELAWGMQGTDKLNSTSLHIGDYEALKEAALDPYVAIRNAYIQNRRAMIKE